MIHSFIFIKSLKFENRKPCIPDGTEPLCISPPHRGIPRRTEEEIRRKTIRPVNAFRDRETADRSGIQHSAESQGSFPRRSKADAISERNGKKLFSACGSGILPQDNHSAAMAFQRFSSSSRERISTGGFASKPLEEKRKSPRGVFITPVRMVSAIFPGSSDPV